MDTLVRQLAAGLETLQEEYQKLFGQHQVLERKLATAREQVRDANSHNVRVARASAFVMRYLLALDL